MNRLIYALVAILLTATICSGVNRLVHRGLRTNLPSTSHNFGQRYHTTNTLQGFDGYSSYGLKEVVYSNYSTSLTGLVLRNTAARMQIGAYAGTQTYQIFLATQGLNGIGSFNVSDVYSSTTGGALDIGADNGTAMTTSGHRAAVIRFKASVDTAHNMQSVAAIGAYVDGVCSSSSVCPGYLQFNTGTASSGNTVKIKIPSDGGVIIKSSADPGCSSTTGNGLRFWTFSSAVGHSDKMKICVKRSNGTKSWFNLYSSAS